MKKEQSMPDFVQLEKDVLEFWENEKAFDKLMQKVQGKPVYKALDGPITANNAMGIHHVWGRTLKDAYIRFKALNGYAPRFRNGFDAHGLPVEVEVEKELGIQNKKQILEFGLENFVNKCMQRVDKYSALLTEQSKRFGQWMDWDNSYYTNSDENITSIWYFLKTVHENGWLVKSSKPMTWCPRCGTSLSAHEMHGSYKDVEHTAVFFKAPVLNKNYSMVVWTTTPWTLTSNVAIAVNPENDYLEVKVNSDTNHLIIGKEALKILQKGDFVSVVREFKGSELVGQVYDTCFPQFNVQKFEHKIVAWDQVQATEGSGAVHIAPGCGAEDYDLGKTLGLPEIMPIDENGIIYEGFGELSGKPAYEVAQLVFDMLSKAGKLYYTHTIKHSYPICWRCKHETLFRLIDSWFIKVDDIRPKLMEVIKDVKWDPEFMQKRMQDWLENMGDWNISRSRYYGVPLPIFITEKGEIVVVGSKQELKDLAVEPSLVDKLPHLHRPFIDQIKIKSPVTGDIATRIPEVGDTWLDAGITSFSTNKYFTDKEFWRANFPSEVVIEMREQVRLWFYSLLLMSVVLEGRAPYDKVIGYESVVQEDGSMFSKSGFSIKAEEFANKMGADTARYMFAGSPINMNVRFSYNLAEEARRKMLGFWNCYTFYNTYAVIDNPNLQDFTPSEQDLTVTDKWLLEITNQFISNSLENYNNNKTNLIVSDFEALVDNISNFYIRSNRKRFWKNETESDKLTAYWVLYRVLKAVTIVMTPIIPFMTEHIWQNLVRQTETNAPLCAMLSDFPKNVYEHSYKEYIEYANYIKNVITLGGRLRNENQLKVKQPLSELFVVSSNPVVKQAVEVFENLLKDELNIKTIINTDDVLQFNDYYLTVNFKNAGAVLKGEVQKLKQALESANDKQMQEFVLQYDNGLVNVMPFENLGAELFIKNSKPKHEFVLANDQDITVVLETTLTPELISEGVLREVIRNAQILRKEADFAIDSRVYVTITSNSDLINNAVANNIEKIKEEVLAQRVNQGNFVADITKTVNVADQDVTISLKTLN